MFSILRKLNGIFPRANTSPTQSPPADIPITDEIFNNYSFIIGSLFTYFNDLSQDNKVKFVKRAHQFKSTKKFHFIGLENNEDMPILVSASAVQVTFGPRRHL